MFSSGLLTKGLIGLISIGSAGGGIGSGLGSLFGFSSQTQNQLTKVAESPQQGLSEKFQPKDQSSESTKEEGVSRKGQKSPDQKTKQEVSPRKPETPKPVSKTFSHFNRPTLTEEEKRQSVVVKTTVGNGMSCFHT